MNNFFLLFLCHNFLLQILCSLLAAATAAPAPDRRYSAPRPRQCGRGQVLKADGSCTEPVVSQKIFAFVAPPTPAPVFNIPDLPDPKVNQAVVFVRTPDAPEQPDPIIVPAPQQQTSVYVLTKNTPLVQKVIEAPASPAAAPEVHYVAYNDGDSLEEVDGHNLRAAFSNAEVGGSVAGFDNNDSRGSDENNAFGGRFGTYSLP